MKKATKKNKSVTIGKPTKAKRKQGIRVSKNKEELFKRRMEEYDLVLKGVNQGKIAEMYGIDRRTVEKDLQVVRAAGGKKFSLQDAVGKLFDYDSKGNKRVARLWKIVVDKKSSNDEVMRAIRELRSEDVEAIKREQIGGILPKESSPLVSVEASSGDGGVSENKVMINIIAPGKIKKKEEDEE